MENQRTILVWSGYNQRAVIAFLRTLERNHISNYLIIALSENDDILKTRYVNKVGYIRTSSELDINIFKQIITSIRKENEGFFLIPSSEYFNRFLLRKRKEIENLGCEIPLVSRRIYEEISDKETFNNLCKENEIHVPERFMIPKNYSEPFVAKPKSYFTSKGKVYSPVLIRCKHEYEKLRNGYPLEEFF